MCDICRKVVLTYVCFSSEENDILWKVYVFSRYQVHNNLCVLCLDLHPLVTLLASDNSPTDIAYSVSNVSQKLFVKVSIDMTNECGYEHNTLHLLLL